MENWKQELVDKASEVANKLAAKFAELMPLWTDTDRPEYAVTVHGREYTATPNAFHPEKADLVVVDCVSGKSLAVKEWKSTNHERLVTFLNDAEDIECELDAKAKEMETEARSAIEKNK